MKDDINIQILTQNIMLYRKSFMYLHDKEEISPKDKEVRQSNLKKCKNTIFQKWPKKIPVRSKRTSQFYPQD